MSESCILVDCNYISLSQAFAGCVRYREATNGVDVTLQYECILCLDEHQCPVRVEQSQAELHRMDPIHTRKTQTLATALMRYIRRSKSVFTVMKSLQGCHVPTEMKLLAYGELIESTEDSKSKTMLHFQFQADRIIWMTPLVLLELVLWKTACILHHPEKCTSVTALLLWMDKGWKENKAAMRRNELIHVVMQNVVPFLEKPPQIKTN